MQSTALVDPDDSLLTRVNANPGGAVRPCPGQLASIGTSIARRVPLVMFAILAAALCWAAQADALVYWANEGTDAIGRANLDGTGVNQSFITGANQPVGLAVNDQHAYWANYNSHTTIGRANLDGTGADQSFITGAADPAAVAVDSNHVYWVNYANGRIGRANLDGTSANQNFIAGAINSNGVAVDASYVYWTNAGNQAIGRANLDGTGVNQSFITGANAPLGVAVDGHYVYWTNSGTGTIGRANLDGTGANQSFITTLYDPRAVAVSGQYIYWTDNLAGSIGRANLDGTSPNQSFITGAVAPQGLAVDAAPYPPPVALFANPSTNYAQAADPSLFQADSSTDPDGRITDYAWNFGDGTTGDGVDVSHVFATPGTYPVTLTVTDDHGMTASISQSVEVAADSPIGSFTSASTNYAQAAEPSLFRADSSTDPGGRITDYAWNFGDGTTGDGVDVSHAFATPGTYSVTLTVTDDDGSTAAISHQVMVATDAPPATAIGQSARRVLAGLPLYLNGVGSSDPDGSVTGYSWSFGDGSSATGIAVDHVYAAPGLYTVVLTTTDDDGQTGSLSARVEVDPPFTVTLAEPPDGSISREVPSLNWSVTGGDGSDPTLTVHLARGSADGRTLHAVGTYTTPLNAPTSGYRIPVALPSGTYAWSLTSHDPRVTLPAPQHFFTVGMPLSVGLTSHGGKTTAVIRSTSAREVHLTERWRGHTMRRTLRLSGYHASYHFGAVTLQMLWSCASSGRHDLQILAVDQAGVRADASFRTESCPHRFRFTLGLPSWINSSQVGQARVATVGISDRWRRKDRYHLCLRRPDALTSCQTSNSSPQGFDSARLQFPVAGGRYTVLLSADGYLIGSHTGTIQVRYPKAPPPPPPPGPLLTYDGAINATLQEAQQLYYEFSGAHDYSARCPNRVDRSTWSCDAVLLMYSDAGFTPPGYYHCDYGVDVTTDGTTVTTKLNGGISSDSSNYDATCPMP